MSTEAIDLLDMLSFAVGIFIGVVLGNVFILLWDKFK